MKFSDRDIKAIMENDIKKLGVENMKVAIITGATSGIGWEASLQIDRRFASLDEIWIIGRREEKLLALQKKLTHSVRTFAMDVTNEQDMKEFHAVLKRLKPNIRMVFQSAGMGLHGKVADLPPKAQTDMIRLNCEALTELTTMCLPFMHKDSHMILLASSAGFMPFPGFAVYGASKAYVLSFARALRSELKQKKIHVLAVCPGPVNTPFFDVSERFGEGMSPFKRAMMNKPEIVVRRALGDAALHKAVSVDGVHIGAFRLFSKVCPKTPVIDFMNRML